MPRPPRCRRICQAPQYETFSPEECPRESEAVTLTLDEYEVIRLVDLEKKTHEQCAAQMDISRTTVTEIYETARKKNCPMYRPWTAPCHSRGKLPALRRSGAYALREMLLPKGI